MSELPTQPLPRPVRVVLFCGPVLERGMVRFAHLLDSHPEVEFLGGFCQTPGLGTGERLADLFRRRGVVALPLLLTQLLGATVRWVRQPGFERRLRRRRAWLEDNLHLTADLHDAAVLDRVRSLEPDLGVIYGGPILRPELFELPRFGTLGIHHGTLPAWRGKKTTFWAMYHGEPRAGVTIQRVNAGIDTGELVRYGSVPARRRSYGRVESELEELGLDLYLDAVVGVRRGTTRTQPIEGRRGRLCRDPRPAQLLRFALRRFGERFRGSDSADAAPGPGVLLLTESFHPMVGGGENQARSLAASLGTAGVDVTVVTRRWDPLQPALALVDGHPVRRIGPTGPGHLKKWGLAFTAWPVIFESRRSHPVLLVNGFRVLGIPAAVAGRRLGARVILKADSPGEMSGRFFDPGLARFGLSHRSLPVRAVLGLRNRLLRGADRFVAISAPVAEELGREGVDPAKISVIPNGIDPAHFRPPEPDERQRLRVALGLPQPAELVLYAGRLVSYKGLPSLTRIWPDVARSHPRAHLVLVGEGGQDIHNCEAALRETVRESGMDDRVSFVGAVEDVAEYLRAADIFVFPTEEEAFGLAAVEAMASGLALVSTQTGGLADFVSEDHGAIVVAAGDERQLAQALIRVLDDPGLRAELGRRGRRCAVERFSLDAVRDQYLELMQMRAR